MKGLKSQDMGFLTGDVAALLKVSPRRIEGWVEQGFIKPAVRGKGPGRRNLFSKEQIFLGALILEIQANCGEKSSLVGRLLPDLGETLMSLARKKPDQVIVIGIGLKAGEIVYGRAGIPQQAMMRLLNRGMDPAHTVVIINVSAILHKFFEDMKD
jgi:Helix-turn-helix domain